MKLTQTTRKKTSRHSHLWFHGDCQDLLSSMDSKSVDLVVTSPPYNIGKAYEKKADLSEYLIWQRKIIGECVRVCKDAGSICWQVGNYVNNGKIIPLDFLFYPIFREFGLQLRNRIVWVYPHGLHNTKRFSGRYENILWFTKSENYLFNLDPIRIPQLWPNKKSYKGPNKGKLSGNPLGKNPSDVWHINNVKSNHGEKVESHPCQFPVQLVERLILSLTREGDTVLDPFGGVATTTVAALTHNRRAISAEIDANYYEAGKARIEKYFPTIKRIRRPADLQL